MVATLVGASLTMRVCCDHRYCK